MTIPSRVLLLLGLLASSGVHAQLTALTYDRSSSSATVAEVNAATGTLADLGTGYSGCCVLGAAANAFNPFSQTVYAFGPDPADANAAWKLHAFSALTGVALPDVTLNQTGRIIGAAFEQVPPRLLALRANAAGNVDLIEVNTATGVLGVLNAGLVDCCATTPNAVAYTGGVVYLSAQLRSGSAPLLFGFPVDGSPATSTPIASPLTVLNSDPDSGLLYGIEQIVSGPPFVASLKLVLVNPATGVFSQLGATVSDCCAIAPDIGAISAGSFSVIAQAIGSSDYSLLSFDIASGSASFSSAPIDDNRTINGMFDVVKGLDATTTTITSIVPSPSEIGQNYIVNVSVTSTSGAVTGTVNVDDGTGGTCTFVLPASGCMLAGTALGPLTISANYLGLGTFAGSSGTAVHTVIQATSTTSITNIAPAGSSAIGQPYTVNVSVLGYGPPTGSVDVDDGAGAVCTIILPAGSCVLTSNTIGPKTISAVYAGDVNNTPSNATAAYAIAPAASITAITSIAPPGSSVVGQPYTVTVSVTGYGIPTGTVVVDDGGGASCNFVLPAASCVLTSTMGGPKTLTASYSGDLQNSASSGTAAYLIDPAPSTTAILSVVPAAPVAGTAYAVTAQVTGFGTPTGTVAIDDANGGNCVVTLPATACNLNSTIAGALTVTAGYSGDASNLPSSDSMVVSVGQASTITVLSAAPNPAIVGMPVQLSATVSQPVAVGVALIGNVDFFDAGNPVAGCSAVPLVAGVAQCSTSFTPAGMRNLSANYLGDANNLSSSGTLDLLVDLVSTTTTLLVTPGQVLPNADVRLDASVTGGVAPLSGTVSITINGVAIAECQALALVSGSTYCLFRPQQSGQFTLVATYSGDVDDGLSSGTVVLVVGSVELPVGGRWMGLLLVLGFLLVGVRAMSKY